MAGSVHGYTAMAVQALADTLAPRGHGADLNRRLGSAEELKKGILYARDGNLRRVLQKLLSDFERKPNELLYQLRQKLRASATYKTIDSYRDDFKVPRASRRDMVQVAKKTVAWLNAFHVAAGPTWEATGFDLKARQRQAEADYRECAQASTKAIYDEYFLRTLDEIKAEAPTMGRLESWKTANEHTVGYLTSQP